MALPFYGQTQDESLSGDDGYLSSLVKPNPAFQPQEQQFGAANLGADQGVLPSSQMATAAPQSLPSQPLAQGALQAALPQQGPTYGSPEWFKNYIYEGGADDAMATQRGLDYITQQGMRPQDAANLWNASLGTDFSAEDYYDVTGTPLPGSPGAVPSGQMPNLSYFGREGGWNLASGAYVDPTRGRVYEPPSGVVFQRGNDVVVGDELFWSPYAPVGDKLRELVQENQSKGYRVGTVVSPYATLVGSEEGKGDPASIKKLAREVANSGVDFVAIDPYVGWFGLKSEDLVNWSRDFLREMQALGKDTILVMQNDVPGSNTREDVIAHNKALMSIPGFSEYVAYSESPDESQRISGFFDEAYSGRSGPTKSIGKVTPEQARAAERPAPRNQAGLEAPIEVAAGGAIRSLRGEEEQDLFGSDFDVSPFQQNTFGNAAVSGAQQPSIDNFAQRQTVGQITDAQARAGETTAPAPGALTVAAGAPAAAPAAAPAPGALTVAAGAPAASAAATQQGVLAQAAAGTPQAALRDALSQDPNLAQTLYNEASQQAQGLDLSENLISGLITGKEVGGYTIKPTQVLTGQYDPIDNTPLTAQGWSATKFGKTPEGNNLETIVTMDASGNAVGSLVRYFTGGDSGVEFYLDAQGNQIGEAKGFDYSEQWKNVVAPIVGMAASAFAGPLAAELSTALGSQIASKFVADIAAKAIVQGGLSAVQAGLMGGDPLKAGLTGAVSGAVSAGGLQLANDAAAQVLSATGSQVAADAVRGAVQAGLNAVPGALASGDASGLGRAALTGAVTSGAGSAASQALAGTGITQQQISSGLTLAQQIQSPNPSISAIANAAAGLVNNPDATVAAKAISLVDTISRAGGNPAALMGVMEAARQLEQAVNVAQGKGSDPAAAAYAAAKRAGATDAEAAAAARQITGGDAIDAATARATGAPEFNVPIPEVTIADDKTSAPVDPAAAEAAKQGFNKSLAIGTNFGIQAAQILKEKFGDDLSWIDQGDLNAAASFVLAGKEDVLRSLIDSGRFGKSGQNMGAGEYGFFSPRDITNVDRDYMPPEGFRIAGPAERDTAQIAYDANGIPIYITASSGATGKRLTAAEQLALEVQENREIAGSQIDPFTGQATEYNVDENSPSLALTRGIVATAKKGFGEQIGYVGDIINSDRLREIGADMNLSGQRMTADITRQGQTMVGETLQNNEGVNKLLGLWELAKTNPGAIAAAFGDWIGTEGWQELLPVGGSVAAGKALNNASKLAFSEKLAEKIGIAGAVTVNAGIDGAEAYQATYNDVKEKLLGMGFSVEQAETNARLAGIGSAIAEFGSSAIGEGPIVAAATKGIPSKFLKSAAAEAPSEAIASGAQDALTQLATQRAGTPLDLGSIQNQAILGGIIGAGTTGAVDVAANLGSQITGGSSSNGSTTATSGNSVNTTNSSGQTTNISVTNDDLNTGNLTNNVTAAVVGGSDAASIVSNVSNAAVNSGVDVNAATNAAVDAANAAGAQVTVTGNNVNSTQTNNNVTTNSTVNNATGDSTSTSVNNTTGDTTQSTTSGSQTTQVSTNAATGATTEVKTDAKTGTATETKTDGNVTSQVTTDTKTGNSTNVTTNAGTNVTTSVTNDANTNTSTTTNTDANTNVTSQVTTDSNNNTTSQVTTDANTNVTTQVTTDANTGINTETTTNSNTGVTSQVTTDSNTNTSTQVTTDSNTNVTTQVVTNSNTGVNTNTSTDANTNITTQVVTDSNTGTNTETVSDPNTGVTTQITTDTTTNTTTEVVTDSNTNVTTQVVTDSNTDVNTNTQTDANTNITTQVVVDTNTNTTTQTVTDSNTNITTQVTTDSNTTTETKTNNNTNVTTQVTTDNNTGTTTQITSNPNTNVTTVTTTNSNVETTTTINTNTNTQTTVVVDVNTGDIIDLQEGEVTLNVKLDPVKPLDPIKPVTELKAVDPIAPISPVSPVVKPTKPTEPTKPRLQDSAAMMLPALGMAGSRTSIDPQFLKSFETQGYIDPLAALKAADTQPQGQDLMQQVDPRLAAILQQRMGQPQGEDPVGALAKMLSGEPEEVNNPYYSYGQEDSIDDILGGKAAGFAKGGYVAPLQMADGGMALPLLAKAGGHAREDFRDGKHVAGDGDGQSDDIPAWLADGEFVFPADVVSALGNGSTKAGTDKLYEMMHGIRERARSKGPKDLPPPALKSPLDYLKSKK